MTSGVRVMTAALLLWTAAEAAAQSSVSVERERRAYQAWLVSAPNSPLRAVAQLPLQGPVTLGPPDADVPLAGLEAHSLEDGRTVRLTGPEGRGPRRVPRNRLVTLASYRLFLAGSRGRTVLTVFGAAPDRTTPSYYEYDSALVFTGTLEPPERTRTVRLLALDGVEVEATEAGIFHVPLGSTGTRLRVRRVPNPGTEESELEIYFRDQTNDDGTYPAGRFVSLIPADGGRYVLDLNRARNPFCAYNSVYPCPIPWPGNAVEARIEAGERYEGGGLDLGSPSRSPAPAPEDP